MSGSEKALTNCNFSYENKVHKFSLITLHHPIEVLYIIRAHTNLVLYHESSVECFTI